MYYVYPNIMYHNAYLCIYNVYLYCSYTTTYTALLCFVSTYTLTFEQYTIQNNVQSYTDNSENPKAAIASNTH